VLRLWLGRHAPTKNSCLEPGTSARCDEFRVCAEITHSSIRPAIRWTVLIDTSRFGVQGVRGQGRQAQPAVRKVCVVLIGSHSFLDDVLWTRRLASEAGFSGKALVHSRMFAIKPKPKEIMPMRAAKALEKFLMAPLTPRRFL